MREVNELGPGKFRTSADDGQEQTCYFNRNKSDMHFSSFVARRVQKKPTTAITFSIVNKSLDVGLSNSKALRALLKDSLNRLAMEADPTDPRLQSQPLSDSEHYSQVMTDDNPQENSLDVPEKKPNFSLKNKIVNRHTVRYTATRIKYSITQIKSRNFLSNISYTGINRNDFYKESFILDVYVLLVKNLNPFAMSRKLTDKNKHEMLYTLWRECIPSEFYRYICDSNNFIYLNGKDVNQPGVLEIVRNFINQGKHNLLLLQENLACYKDILQYVYSHVFPEVYTATEKRGFDLRSNFHIMFKTYCNKMMLRQQVTAKNTENYEKE